MQECSAASWRSQAGVSPKSLWILFSVVEIIVQDVQSNNICISLIRFSICASPVSVYNCSGKPLSYSRRKNSYSSYAKDSSLSP